MQERSETEGYAKSVSKMLNCIPLPQGPTLNRDGFAFQQEFDGHEHGRIKAIQRNATAYMAVAFINNEVRAFTDQGSPLAVFHPISQNPSFAAFGKDWDTITDGDISSTVDFNHYACIISCDSEDNRFAGIKQDAINPSWSHTPEIEIIIESNVEDNDNVLNLMVGTTDGGADLLQESINLNSQSFELAPNMQRIYVQVRTEGETTSGPVVVSRFSVTVAQPKDEVVTPYVGVELYQLKFIPSAADGVVYVTHPNHPPYQLSYDGVYDNLNFDIVIFTEQPAEWVENNYPSCGVVHKNRLWLAGTPNEPSQLWASKISAQTDFTYGALETDALSVVSQYPGQILWMVSSKSLAFGSASGENIITSDGPTIFIGDIQIDRQSTYGSADVQAVQAGDKILYVTVDRGKFQAMQYDRNSENWLSDELSFPSSHLVKGGQHDFSWQKNPVSLFWIVRADGTLACMSYNRPMDIVGWAGHDTQGKFVSVDIGQKGVETRILALVNRGDGKLKFEQSNSNGPPMDSKVTVVLDPPGTIVSGLDHLEGKLCQVVADGAVHPDRTVVGGGITLQLSATRVQVGRGFRKQITTLPFDKGSDKGSGRAYMKRYKDVYVKLLDSHVPFINGKQAPIRYPSTPMGEAEDTTSNMVKVHSLGYSRGAKIDIIQDGPLSLKLQGIYGEVSQDKA